MNSFRSCAVLGGCALLGIWNLVSVGCGGDSPSAPSTLEGAAGAVYPMFADDDGNGVNDLVEAFGHDAGSPAIFLVAPGSAGHGHAFTDVDGDGICDFAQNGSHSWHGPGFVDNDGDGVCDYWDDDTPLFNTHAGQKFRHSFEHRHRNTVRNAYMMEPDHAGCGHPFVDGDGDGLCDHAQRGGRSWHGPGFIDADGNGICDHYDENGAGRFRHRNRHQERF